MVSSADPVAAGFLVTSLARPGGIVTGLAGFLVDLGGKLLELLLAAVPKVKRVGLLADPGNANLAMVMKAARQSATHYSAEALFAEAGRPEEIDSARRSSRRAANQIRAGGQHENRQGARPYDSADDHGAR